MRPPRLVVASALLLTACSGEILGGKKGLGLGGDGGTGSVPVTAAQCTNAPVNVPVVALQRLTSDAFLNTERDLFQQPAIALNLDTADATSPTMTQLEAQKVNDAAAQLVATGGHHRFVGCSLSGGFNDTCAQGFIKDFGLRAFRRPLDADEVTWLTGVYQKVKALPGLSPAVTFTDAIDAVAQVMVQSPQHLYLTPQGVTDATLPTGLNRTTGYERATTLAYGLTQSTPDDTLLQAAASGDLDTPEGLRSAAGRLLDGASGHTTVRGFIDNYLGLGGDPIRPSLTEMPKTSSKFPLDSPDLRVAMRTESAAFYEHVFFDLGGAFSALMNSTDAYVNGPLAQLYGVKNGPTTAGSYAWVSLDNTQRAGLFTRAAFLTEMANQDYESPIQRGVQVFKYTLCQALGPPPPNANNNGPAIPQGSQSVRQMTDLRTAATTCQGCHAQFNPIGYSFNHFDALGQWQDSEVGTSPDGGSFTVPVDSVATVPATDLKGAHTGAVQLSQALAQSNQAMGCMAQQWLTRVQRRPLATEDACTSLLLQDSFQKSGGDMHGLVLDAIASPATLYVRVQ